MTILRFEGNSKSQRIAKNHYPSSPCEHYILMNSSSFDPKSSSNKRQKYRYIGFFKYFLLFLNTFCSNTKRFRCRKLGNGCIYKKNEVYFNAIINCTIYTNIAYDLRIFGLTRFVYSIYGHIEWRSHAKCYEIYLLYSRFLSPKKKNIWLVTFLVQCAMKREMKKWEKLIIFFSMKRFKSIIKS